MQTFIVYLIHVKYLIVKIAAKQILETWFSIHPWPTQEHTLASSPTPSSSLEFSGWFSEHSVTTHH